MYAIYGNIYHQYTPNVSIYTIHGSYGKQTNWLRWRCIAASWDATNTPWHHRWNAATAVPPQTCTQHHFPSMNSSTESASPELQTGTYLRFLRGTAVGIPQNSRPNRLVARWKTGTTSAFKLAGWAHQNTHIRLIWIEQNASTMMRNKKFKC